MVLSHYITLPHADYNTATWLKEVTTKLTALEINYSFLLLS